MISESNYEIMKEKYGLVGSWAIWIHSKEEEGPKSHTDDMSWLSDTELLNKLNTEYVFVGLNWSSTHGEDSNIGEFPWANFHSGYSRQNDFKLRYALTDTKFWGSYITDLIKYYPEVNSKNVRSYLNQHPEVIKQNIDGLLEELSYLGKYTTIIALGDTTYYLLSKNLPPDINVKLIKITHYSSYCGKEQYREKILKQLEAGTEDDLLVIR